MKKPATPSAVKPSSTRLLGAFWCGLLACCLLLPARGQEDPVKTGAYRASVAQEQLRQQTKRLLDSMNAMLEEFRNNPVATEEVALTEATIARLQSLSEKDMAAVVSLLREASKADSTQAGDKIVAANRTAQEVRSNLVRLADKLALYHDETSIELRVKKLIRRQLANRRQTNYLINGQVRDWEKKQEEELAINGQKGIKDDVDSLLVSLNKLANHPTSTNRALFASLLQAGNAAGLESANQSALAKAEAKEFAAAATAQGQTLEGLEAMLMAINSTKKMEERVRDAQTQMERLATREEILARNTLKGWSNQNRVQREQQDIADERTMLEEEIAQLNPATANLMQQTRQAMEEMDKEMQAKGNVINEPQKKPSFVARQNDVADKFDQIAEMLKQQGDALASASNSAAGQGGMDATTQAMANASQAVMDALGQMDAAQGMVHQGGDTSAAMAQMSQAQGNLSKAQQQLAGAGLNSPEAQSAAGNLGKSSESLGKGQQQAGAAGKNAGDARGQFDREMWQAKGAAQKALEDMQKAMSAHAAAQSQLMADGQAGNPSGDNQGSGSGAGWGAPGQDRPLASGYNALAEVSEKDREALSSIPQDKAPPEYNAMAEQYLKNLANGTVPGQ